MVCLDRSGNNKEMYVFMKCGEFLEQLSRSALLEEDCLVVLNIWLVLLYYLRVRQSVYGSEFGDKYIYLTPILVSVFILKFFLFSFSRISKQSAHKCGKVASPKHRPPLTPGKYSWYSFLLEFESTPGP